MSNVASVPGTRQSVTLYSSHDLSSSSPVPTPSTPYPRLCRRYRDDLVSLGKPAYILSFPLRIYGQTCCNYGRWRTLDSYGQSQLLGKGSAVCSTSSVIRARLGSAAFQKTPRSCLILRVVSVLLKGSRCDPPVAYLLCTQAWSHLPGDSPRVLQDCPCNDLCEGLAARICWGEQTLNHTEQRRYRPGFES